MSDKPGYGPTYQEDRKPSNRQRARLGVGASAERRAKEGKRQMLSTGHNRDLISGKERRLWGMIFQCFIPAGKGTTALEKQRV